MKNKIIYFWSILQSSFWFVPLLLVVSSIIAATGFIYLDNNWDFASSGVISFYVHGGADAARSILSTIAGAMIGVAGTVFSITLVALTLASSQFGPRLLQNFMHDRINQVVLGSYIATFTYCLLVLRAVKSDGEMAFIPNISITFAIVLAIVNILLLVVFIHHISVNIQADQVISNVNLNLRRNFKRLFPKEENGNDLSEIDEEKLSGKKSSLKEKLEVYAQESGYLQSVDHTGLFNLAKDLEGLVEVKKHAGNFIIEGQVLALVLSANELEVEKNDQVKSFFIIGRKRTSTQDVEFSIRQMVEVAARALSPGVNDPFTAITCIDKLTDIICYLTSAKLPSPYHFDEEGEVFLITKTISFEDVMNVSFNQIRQYGKDAPAVIIRLMEAMLTIYNFSKNEEQRKIVKKHARMIMHLGKESFVEENDIDDLRARYEQLI
ncbi:DUF2254 domain-containing protein [Echinicola salinicaeni]|uniref:DUF2254 domain-containing protein n=1 Tax=Echinicola salinicaeni TaxID=2762757 RepID=UPI0016476F37|nr:DUF2254 domain-containing protein [Echinicola salinicaeni]